MNTRETGTQKEQTACAVLEAEGLRVIETNYRVRTGEIDIIAEDGDALVFIEVKYRKNRNFGGAEYAIPEEKKQKIRKVAAYYLIQHHLPPDMNCRFDAVLITGDEINHIVNAW